LADAFAGRSRVTVLRGEAGFGKSALLGYLADRVASGWQVARAVGVESEMELDHAGLHQLCAPMLERLERLPVPQRDALATVFGLSAGPAPDRFLVGLATLTLFAEVAEQQPLVLVVDDAQWLDHASAQILGFVARRLLAERIALVCAARTGIGDHVLAGLPELPVRGLGDSDARALLLDNLHGPIDAAVCDQIVAESRGNPLALLELPRGLSPAELAGGFQIPAAGDVHGQIAEHYLRRVTALPEATQQLLLLAAADPVGDATLLWRSAQRLGIEASALSPARDADLLEIGARVRFRHPLVRSAVYGAASLNDRQSAHEALAEESDPEVDADRRAWHRALAAAGLDEEVAAELEHSAGRAQTRGGVAAAAAFLERAAALTLDPARRARRALAAAQAKHQAGAPQAALALLASAQAGPLDQLQRAQAELLRGQIMFALNRGSDAPPLLLRAAKQLEPLDATLARETYLEALMAAQFAGRSASGGAVLEVAQAARTAPPAPTPRAPDLLLDGLAVMITEGHGAGAPLLRRAVDAFLNGDVAGNGGFRWLWLAEEAAQEVWNFDAWHELAVLQLELVREAGALTVLPLAFHAVICARIYAGELAAAAALLDDQRNATEATGSKLAPYGELILTTWQGRDAHLSALVKATLEEIVPRGEGIGVSTCQWVTAILDNSLGRYEGALAAAQQVIDPPRKLDWTVNAALPELIESATRMGDTEHAQVALEQFSALTRPSGTDWGLGLEARCRALLSEAAAAEPLYREAIERLGRTHVRGEHARAHLLYGEWLRRNGRRMDGREQLRTAHDMFAAMGMEAFAERARGELLATGETVRKRTVDTRDELTAQERQIARLARQGLSNPEISTQLFLSPRTVEWHLRKVFAKLGIRSRRQLRAVLSEDGRVVANP
jgi:DNA-binding CsgD family transcriptional regulator